MNQTVIFSRPKNGKIISKVKLTGSSNYSSKGTSGSSNNSSKGTSGSSGSSNNSSNEYSESKYSCSNKKVTNKNNNKKVFNFKYDKNLNSNSEDSLDYKNIINILQDENKKNQDLLQNLLITKNLDKHQKKLVYDKITDNFLHKEGDEKELYTEKITTFINKRLNEIIKFNYYYDQHINYFSSGNTKNDQNDKNKDGFYLDTIPGISIDQYLQRFIILSEAELSTVIIMIILLERLTYNFKYKLTENNIHLLLFTAFIIAIKMNEDKIFNNVDFAEFGGISIKMLYKLEVEFLNKIDFKTFVSPFVFYSYSSRFI
jgi:hypothetical protein